MKTNTLFNLLFRFNLYIVIALLWANNSFAQTSSILIAPAKDANKWGYIDQAGKWLVKPTYQFANEFSENLAAVQLNNKWGYIDATGQMTIDVQYEDAYNFVNGFARVRKNNLWGYINSSGQSIIEPQFDSANDFSEGMALVLKNGHYGFINEQGNVAVPLHFDEAFDFAEGLALVSENKEWQYIDRNSNIVPLPECDHASSYFSEGLAVVSKNNTYGYVNNKGKWVINPQYKAVGPFSQYLASVLSPDKKRYGFINTKGDFIIPPIYEAANHFSENLAAVSENGQFGYINTKGEWVIPPQFENAEPFKNNLAKVQIDGKYNFVDANGKIISPQNFNWVFEFSEGLAAVQVNSKYGYINPNGTYTIQPTYAACGSFQKAKPYIYAETPIIETLQPTSKNIEAKTADFTYSYNVISVSDIIDYTIVVNNNIYEELNKKGTTTTIKKNGKTTNISGSVKLKEGNNVVYIKVSNQNATNQSQPIIINYKPTFANNKKPNLYILTVGIAEFLDTNYNINYADNDAIDISKMFLEQRNMPEDQRIFGEITVETLTNEEATRENIQKTILNMKKIVSKNDIFLFFISTHGEIGSDNQFYLRVYNTDPGLEMLSVNGLSNQWLVERINEFDGTVIQLMDACHSAKAGMEKDLTAMKAGMSETDMVVRDLQATLSGGKGVYFYASSNSKQLSQERHEWQNGAFTEAIIGCFNQTEYIDFKNKPVIADPNHDGFIYTDELESYISSVVKKITNGEQNPRSHLKNAEPIPIFVLPKK
jgi:hypothetical protein